MERTKACTKCHRELSLSAFGNHRLTKDGLAYRCKECARMNSWLFRQTPAGIFSNIKGRVKFRNAHPERIGLPKKFNISKKDFIRWYNSQPKICAYCGISEEELHFFSDEYNDKADRLTIDCKNNDVGYVDGNLVLACHRCNTIKSNLFSFETMREIGRKYILPIWKKKMKESAKT